MRGLRDTYAEAEEVRRWQRLAYTYEGRAEAGARRAELLAQGVKRRQAKGRTVNVDSLELRAVELYLQHWGRAIQSNWLTSEPRGVGSGAADKVTGYGAGANGYEAIYEEGT